MGLNQIRSGTSDTGKGSLGSGNERRESERIPGEAIELVRNTTTLADCVSIAVALDSSDGLTAPAQIPAHASHFRGVESGTVESALQSSSASVQQADSKGSSLPVRGDSRSQHVTRTPALQSTGGPTSRHAINSLTAPRIITSILLIGPTLVEWRSIMPPPPAAQIEAAVGRLP